MTASPRRKENADQLDGQGARFSVEAGHNRTDKQRRCQNAGQDEHATTRDKSENTAPATRPDSSFSKPCATKPRIYRNE